MPGRMLLDTHCRLHLLEPPPEEVAAVAGAVMVWVWPPPSDQELNR